MNVAPADLSPAQVSVVKSISDRYKNILDLSFRRLSSSSDAWKLLGEIAVPRCIIDPDADNEVEWEWKMTIQTLSELTGISITNIFQIFDENRNFYCVSPSVHPTPDVCTYNQVKIALQYKLFLENEGRSGVLHLAFRNSVLRAFRRRISDMMKDERLFVTQTFLMLDSLIPFYHRPSKLGVFFRFFSGMKWDIRIEMDLQNDSDMSEIIDLSHKSFITHGLANINDTDEFFGSEDTDSTLLWLIKQFQVMFAWCQC